MSLRRESPIQRSSSRTHLQSLALIRTVDRVQVLLKMSETGTNLLGRYLGVGIDLGTVMIKSDQFSRAFVHTF